MIARDCGIPDRVGLATKKIAGGAQTRVRLPQSKLKQRTLGERRARVEPALVGVGERDYLGERALRDSDCDGADMQRGVEERLRHRRTRDRRLAEKNIEAVVRRYDQIFDCDIVTAGAAESV